MLQFNSKNEVGKDSYLLRKCKMFVALKENKSKQESYQKNYSINKSLKIFCRLLLISIVISPFFLLNGCKPTGYVFDGGVPAQNGNPVGLNQSVLVIYVRASDDATNNLPSLRTSEQAEFGTVNTFFLEQSFNKCSFAYTHAPTNVWYVLPKTYDNYIWTPADITAAGTDAAAVKQATDGQNLLQDFNGFFTDALQKASDDGFNIGSFSQICVEIIGPFFRGTSYGTTNFTLKDQSNNNFQVAVPVVVVSTQSSWSRTGHEFGHAFGKFADLYNTPTRRVGNWDIMDCTDCTDQTTGWHKETKAGWLTGGQVKTITRPVGTTQKVDNTILIPYETQNPSSGGIQSLKLDVGGNLHLYVENRQTLAGQVGSRQLPANAVIITDADDNADQVNASRPPILLFGGPITSGNSFTDNSYGPLKIEVSGTNPNLNVKTIWGPNPYFDLVINPWIPPPYQSSDIWVDSQSNGWDTYENSDATKNPSVAGNPVRNGDRPWVSHENRVYARIHNTGSTDASNVVVSYYVNTPPGIGDAGNWSLLEKKTIPLVAAGTDVIAPYAIWKPGSNDASHTCLQVVIDYQTGELNANNNAAQSNITDFNTSSSSPWSKIESSVQVANPTDHYQQIRIEMTKLPSGWTGWVSKRFLNLAPKKVETINYTIDPNGGTNKINDSIRPGMSFDINIQGWLKYIDNEVNYGGVTAAIHAVVKVNGVKITSYPTRDSIGRVSAVVTARHNIPNAFPLTLEFVNLKTNERQVIISQNAPNISGNIAVFTFDLNNYLNTNLLKLEKGTSYSLSAYISGNKFIEGGIESTPVKFVMP